MTRDAELVRAGEQLRQSELAVSPVDPVSAAPWGVQPDEAYRVQLAQADSRRGAGAVRSGFKVGLTSTGMQTLLGVTEPDFGHLFADMAVPDGGVIDRADFILPRAEPELAFVLGGPLGAEKVSRDDVIAATDYVTVSIELVDSRVRDWKITWADTVSDNGSSSRYVLGDARVDLSTVAASLTGWRTDLMKNDEVVGSAPLSEVMGDPIDSVRWLVETLFTFGITMGAGDVILSGSPCAATNLLAGDRIVATIENVGTVSVLVAGASGERAKGTS
ncbi:MAG: 2-keto-4-pentenoate hydratase [Microbacteriaceae bacterium]|nr:2-keto-4-pentenoate hydratase [Microbacteriaceae bacterium]